MGQEKQSYNFKEREKHWQEYWEKEGIYKFNPKSRKPVFSVDTPPPTISGKLHLGHVFSYTHAEVIVRFQRMLGKQVFYPLGLDNNGLPTELLVEKDFNISAQDLGPTEFTKLVLEKLPAYHQLYFDLFRSLGFSFDYSLLYETISPEVRELVQKTFLDFQKQGLIYEANKPALYCWQCQTSVAQAEVEDKSLSGIFYDIKFKRPNGAPLIIATTRPELLPACVAVFVHPQDKRYKELVGQEVETPLGEKVKVYPEEEVEQEKGTGVVMICSYGDETDLALIEKHHLPEKITFGRSGKFLEDFGVSGLKGKTIAEAKEFVANWLENNAFIETKKAIEHDVGVHERCGTPIEILPTRQYFVKVLPYKKKILAAGRQVNWYPKFMQKRFEDWVENLKWDWCISRERYYGIAIPGEENLFFDTWFTSSQTPDILGTPRPLSLRAQAHDIIRTWAFYTIVMAVLKHKGTIPWQDIMISGHILAKKGAKISKKTGGGAYPPEELIVEHGADAVRYAMCTAGLGKDAYFEEKELKDAKRLITKLINAGRLMTSFGITEPALSLPKGRFVVPEKLSNDLHLLDRWIVYQSQKTALAMAQEFERYEYAKARSIFERFFWSDFCDNYLELVKYRLYAKDAGAQSALAAVFLNILKMLAPFMPYITEELYQKMYQGDEKSLHLTLWPKAQKQLDPKIKDGAALLLEVVSLMRKAKSEQGISLGKEIKKLTVFLPQEKHSLLEPFLTDLKQVSRAEDASLLDGEILQVELSH
ncbi:MAG: class I tRNA ligase family protein [bacterium]